METKYHQIPYKVTILKPSSRKKEQTSDMEIIWFSTDRDHLLFLWSHHKVDNYNFKSNLSTSDHEILHTISFPSN